MLKFETISIKSTVFASLLAILALAGCVSAPVQQAENQALPSQELDGELLYNLLAGEFAGMRGHMRDSAEFYLQAASQTQDPRVAQRAAHIALFAQRYDDALDAITRWEELAPAESEEIARMRTLAYLHLGEADEAVINIRLLLLQNGEVDEDAVASLAHVLQKESKPDVALVVVRKLNLAHPDSPRLMLLQARYEIQAGDHDKALDLAERVIRLTPKNSDAWLVKAQALAQLQKENEAMAAVGKAVELRPDDTQLRLQYARMLVQRKEYPAALEHFRVMYEQMPDNNDVLLSLGLLSLETGQLDRGKEYMQELIDRDAHPDPAHYYLGRVQQNQGDIGVAIANYQRVSGGEYYLDARIRAAALLAASGDVEKAMVQLQSLLASQDDSADIRVYLAQGEVLRNANRDADALNIYSSALKTVPENTDLLYARALTAERLNLIDMAESDLRLVLVHEPENANALNALGFTLADHSERLQEARSYILKAVELLPDEPAILDSLGWVYYRLGQHEEAIAWLRKAFERMQDAEIAAHLGEVLWVSGQLEEADRVWQRGLAVNPQHPLLLKTIQRLKP